MRYRVKCRIYEPLTVALAAILVHKTCIRPKPMAASLPSTVNFKSNEEIGSEPSFTIVAVTSSELVRAVECQGCM